MASYLRFLALVLTIAAALVGLGWMPTERWAGVGAIPAMVAGCLIAAFASAIGGLPIALVPAESDRRGLEAIFASMAVRLVTAMLAALGTILFGPFPGKPLLLWVAIGYLVLLPADVAWAVRTTRARSVAAGKS